MSANPQLRRLRHRRWTWAIALFVAMGLTATGAYAYYTHRRERNTQKLLADAREAVAVSDWEEAVASYNLYLRRNPGDMDSLVAYSEALLKRLEESPELLGETLRVTRRVISAQPTNPKPLATLVSIYLQLGEFTQAEDLAKQWNAVVPDSTQAVLAIARARHGLHREADAAKVLMDAIHQRPGDAALYPPLIELLRESLDQPDQAAIWLSRALEVAPDAAEIQLAAFLTHHREGRMEEAEQHLRKALSQAPDDLRVLTSAASFHLSRENLAEADQMLRRAETVAPKHRTVLAARTAWAIRQNAPDALAGTADQLAATAERNDFDLIARAAELYLRAGQMERADECIAKLAAAPRPTDAVVARLDTLRGARLLMSGRPYAAIPHLDKALRRDSKGLWAAELLAMAYVSTGVPDEAADLYRRILQASPQLTAARLALARLELRQGRFAEARQQANLLVNPRGEEAQQAELIRVVCDARLNQGNETSTHESIRTVASAGPTNPEIVELLLHAMVLTGQDQAAIDFLADFNAEPKRKATLAAELGRLLLGENRTEAASRLADQWIQRFPDAIEGHVLRVRALAKANRLDEAKAAVESSGLESTSLGKLWELLADQPALVDNDDAARDALRRALPLLPGDIGVRHRLIRQLNTLDETMPLVDEIRTAEGPDGVQWRFEKAWALARHDREKSAGQVVDLLKQCLAVRPGWTSARVLMGSAHEALGAWSEAADAYRTAITQDPRLATDTVAVRLIETLKRLGRFAEADAALAPLIVALPDSPEVLRLEMEKQLRNRRVDSAAEVAQRILELSGDDASWAAVTADLQLRAGQPEKAERVAREGLVRHPDSASLVTSLARSLIAQNRPDDAENSVRGFAAAQDTGVAHVLLAQMLVFMRKDADAEAAIATALAKSPTDAAVVAAAADFWSARGDRAKQLAHARRALELRGESASESLTLATLLATGGTAAERSEAEAIVERRLNANGNDPAARLLQAQLAATARPPDYPAAERSAEKALAADPRSLEAYRTLAAIQGRSGRIAAADETVAAALNIAPDDPELLLTAVQMQCHRGEYDQALTTLRRLLNARPRMPEALRMFAAASRFAGQTDKAIAFIEQQAPPEQWTALENVLLAKLYEPKGDAKKAETLFAAAFDRDKRSPEIFQEYVHFLSRRGALDQVYALASQRRLDVPHDLDSIAIAAELMGTLATDSSLRQTGLDWLTTLATDHPDRAGDAFYRVGLSHYQAGDWRNAEVSLTKALQHEPRSPRAVNALAWLYCENLSQPEKALKLIEQHGAAGGTQTAELLDTHATVLLRLNRLEEAKKKLIACLDLAGQTATYTAANYHLGLVLVRLDAAEEGRSYLRTALQLHRRVGGLSSADQKEAERLLTEG